MSELLKINVNEHTEKKNGLSYLSWAWAWAEVLKIDPRAFWQLMQLGPEESPAAFFPDGSAMVGVTVTIKDDAKSCVLPVMDHRNKAIKNPDAFAINTAIMRCLAKAIAMHGLGLYIYAGEDLPEDDPKTVGADMKHSPSKLAFEAQPEDWQAYLCDLARDVENIFEQSGAEAARLHLDEAIERDALDDSHESALWYKVGSKARTAIDALTKGKK